MSSASPKPVRRSALWPLLATVVGIAAGIALGTWQLGRAQQKLDLKARIDARAAEPPINVPGAELSAADVDMRRIEARGVFDPRHAIYLDNRIHRGRPGYQVVMPFRIEGTGRHVLVNRGWIPAGADRSQLPEAKTPRETVVLRGRAFVPGMHSVELSQHVIEGRVWQNLTIERYRSAHEIAIQPFVMLQDSPLDDGLAREWPAPDLGIDRHYGYAFQWFALSATLLAFYAVTRFRRARQSEAA